MSLKTIRKNQKGAALVIVLWAALLVSAALAIALMSARIEAQITAAREETFIANVSAKSGLDFAAQWISMENSGSLDGLTTLEFSINGYGVRFAPAIESEKLDINLAGEQTLKQFFEFLGVKPDEAAKLAARTADWRDVDDLSRANGAERHDYATARNGERIGNRPFYSADELRLVLGMPEEIARCAMPALTIFGDGGAPSDALLSKVYGRNMDRSDALQRVQLGTSSRSAAAGRRYAITATAEKESARHKSPTAITGVFRITGARHEPYEWIAQFEPASITENPLSSQSRDRAACQLRKGDAR